MKLFLISGKAESGKDTLHTIGEQYVRAMYPKLVPIRIAFADAVKQCAKDMGWDGNKDDNGRSGLIMIGDGARKYFDSLIWVKKAINKLEVLDYTSPCENRPCTEDIVFITDCRYPNEVDMLKEWALKHGHSAYAIRIERPDHVSKLTHEQLINESETSLDDYGQWDIIVENKGTYEDFVGSVETVIDHVVCLRG